MSMSVSALSVHSCESDPEVVWRRAHHEAANEPQRQDHAEGKHTCAHCTSAMLREPVALKGSADRFPPPMQAFRQ